MTYPKRLIEVDLPIKRISAHARREKSIRPGHISTLHIWWARRPLASCRAVILAALWPDPADPNCPTRFRDEAAKAMKEFRDLRGGQTRNWDDPIEVRAALLDFIADFANWDNSTNQDFLKTSRRLVQVAHESLGGAPGTRPLVVDPFAGGGSIPLEALRVGADAYASDLNPVAVLLNKVVLEYIPKHGPRLAEEVRKWGEWVKKEAEKELDEFYPKDPEGSTPIAYLWARTIRCEGPGCGAEIPLIRNMQITRDSKLWHFRLDESPLRTIVVAVGYGKRASDHPTVAAGSVTCPRAGCGYTTPAKAVRAQLIAKKGGANDAKLLAVYVDGASGRLFRNPTERDHQASSLAKSAVRRQDLPQDEINSTRPFTNTRGLSAVTRIGITHFGDLYTSRQAAVIQCFQRILLRLPNFTDDQNLRSALLAVLNCTVSRFIFQNCSLSRWNAARSTIEGAFGKQALQVVWDFAEANPLSDGPASWNGAVEWVLKVIEANACLPHPGTVVRGRAQDRMLPADTAGALITDPPYFAAIPYGDLSNVFFVWERTIFRAAFPDLFNAGLVRQEDEIVVTNANVDSAGDSKSADFYRREMVKALDAARVAVKPDGIGVVVFAESSTSSWEAMLGAVIEAGWLVSGSWPIDTELQTRTQAAGSASLQSSVHIVCRPRENPDGSVCTDEIGDWRDVLEELPARIHEWMPRLASEGVVGADAIFACLGPALEIFSRYSRVDKPDGTPVPLNEYLERVWATVEQEALAMVFEGADASGFEEDARLTAMWLWTLGGGSSNGDAAASSDDDGNDSEDDDDEASPKSAKGTGFALEYDAARKIAQGLGAHLEALMNVVEVKGDKARLLSVQERAEILFGRSKSSDGNPSTRIKGRKKEKTQVSLFAELEKVEEKEFWGEKGAPEGGKTVLDRVHQAMILFAASRSEALRRFLVDEGAGQDGRFWRLGQALAALYPKGSDERRWIEGVMGRKKGLGF